MRTKHITALAIFLLVSAASLRAQDGIAPPDLWSIATGDKIPAADTLKTKQYGALVGDPTRVIFARWWFRDLLEEGLRPGDIILAVDGLRIFGSREFQLARFRNALSTSMTMLINRDGDLQWIKLHDLEPGRTIATNFDVSTEQDRILAAVESIGLPLDDAKTRDSIVQLPPQVAAELDEWAKANPNNTDTAWLSEFLSLYTALQNRQYATAVQPAHEPPIPYIARLEKLYVKMAAENTPKEVEPDLAKSGETPEFYVLALPIPVYQPPLGDLKFTDRRFQTLLTRRYKIGDQPDSEITAAANRYATSGSDGLDLYIDQVRAALLDPAAHWTAPYNSPMLRSGAAKGLLLQSLMARMKEPTAPDYSLDLYAMIAIQWEAGAITDLAPNLQTLSKVSPYLARTAAGNLYLARHLRKRPWKQLEPAKRILAVNSDFLGPDAPALYIWALQKVHPAARTFQLEHVTALPDPHEILWEAPYAELSVLNGTAPPPTPQMAADGTQIYDPDIPSSEPSPSPAAAAPAASAAPAAATQPAQATQSAQVVPN